jgi:hypothetical protein
MELNQLWDPTGTRVVGYANGSPQQVILYTRPDLNYRIYQGIDFTVESRPTPNWDLYAAYTLSWLYGPGAEEFGQIGGSLAGNSQFYNPRQAMFYDGFLPEDVRHQIKVHGSYVWKGLSMGGDFTYLTGVPLTAKFFNNQDGGFTNRRSPQGTEPGTPNDPYAVAEFRQPPLLVVDARVTYDFYELTHQHLLLIADLFNLFNLGAANSPNGGGAALENQNVPSFGQVTSHQQPFRFQLGLRYTY